MACSIHPGSITFCHGQAVDGVLPAPGRGPLGTRSDGPLRLDRGPIPPGVSIRRIENTRAYQKVGLAHAVDGSKVRTSAGLSDRYQFSRAL